MAFVCSHQRLHAALEGECAQATKWPRPHPRADAVTEGEVAGRPGISPGGRSNSRHLGHGSDKRLRNPAEFAGESPASRARSPSSALRWRSRLGATLLVDGLSHDGSPQHGSPQQGSPQQGSPQHGSPQHGSPQHTSRQGSLVQLAVAMQVANAMLARRTVTAFATPMRHSANASMGLHQASRAPARAVAIPVRRAGPRAQARKQRERMERARVSMPAGIPWLPFVTGKAIAFTRGGSTLHCAQARRVSAETAAARMPQSAGLAP